MLFSIDRKVGGRAVLIGEDRQPWEVDAGVLPSGAKEGDMVRYADGVFLPAPQETEARRRQMADALARLMRRDDSDDKP